MPNVTVKDIPEKTYETLKEIAFTNHRSLNGELLNIIEKATTCQPYNYRQHLEWARQSRARTNKFLLTEKEVNLAKNEGRL